jgi:hypothetical protein
VVIRSPLPNEEFISSGETLELNFSWTPVNFTGSELTRLEIAGDRRFNRILEFRETETSGTALELSPGIYWWRAYAIGPSGVSEPEKAAPQKFIIARAEPLIPALIRPEEAAAELPEAPLIPAPLPAAAVPARQTPAKPDTLRMPDPLLPAAEERQPENNYRIGPSRLRQSLYLTFHWKGVRGANAYILTLLDSSGREIFKTAPLAESSYTLDLRSIDRGNFIWKLEAVQWNGETIERRGLPAENSFTIDIPLPGNPQVNEPGILYGIEP